MAYSESKNLEKRTISDKILKDRAYEIPLASMIYKFLIKKTGSGAIATSKVGISVNEQLAQELHKPVIKKLKRSKVYARFKDNI